jgi:eukaryotic-like serine/threonine-protein kinase
VAEVEVGSVVDGRYQVLARIGGGGMADVWLAEDTHLQRRIALKVLHGRFAQDREFVMRFQREAEAAAGLQHPNIVSVFDRGEWGGTYYIAMQYIEGPTLKQLIDSGITIEQGVAVIRQVLGAAGYAHRQGIVHRDLKPQNVIVDPEGKAVVTDFGIARAGVSEITQTGSVMGTPHYLSPEQAQGFEVTAVSDLYSVGVMLYEALTGRVPFEGESAVAVAMKQVSQMPQRPSSIQPRVSPALDAVVMRALEKDPGQRFQSADAFIAALDQAMREPGNAGRGTTSFAALPPVVAEPGEEVEDPEAARKRRRNWWILAALVAILIGAVVGIFASRSTPTTNVPNVHGRNLQRAEEILEQRGFTVNQPPIQVHRQVEAGTVLEQDPGASPPSRQAEENCSFLTLFCSKPAVTLTISIGPGEGVVPKVAGLSAEEATKKLAKAEFEVATEAVNSDSVEAGLVVSSEPGGGKVATHGSTVTLFVSAGPKLVKVPVLVNSQRRLAVQEIRALGLVPDVVEEETESAAPGEVIKQQPSAGTELEPGETVAIAVAKAVAKIKVPGLVGQERKVAVEEVRARGLFPSVIEEEVGNEAKIGLVIRQTPHGGEESVENGEVVLVVGKRTPKAPKEEVKEPEPEEEGELEEVEK